MADGTKRASPRAVFRGDEPAETDGLDRDRYARAFAQLAQTCDTPMVVGLYGGWGTGKSSLMMQIRVLLRDDGMPTVWFDPWQHQFDENPLIALLQTTVTELGMETAEGVKETLTSVAAALMSPIANAATGLDANKLMKLTDAVAEERFRMRDVRIRLRDKIGHLIAQARKRDKRPGVAAADKRVVFFIDDLDRCLPVNMLRMLEALKLYLNVDNCVYFLGLDHNTVKNGIAGSYADVAIGDQEYLDKIVQIPFLIPRIHKERARAFIEGLLPEGTEQCADDLAAFLGDNPRQVKRFINNLSLNLLLAEQLSGDETPSVDLIVALLLLQHQNEKLFRQVSVRAELFFELQEKDEAAAGRIAQDLFDGDTQLQRLIQRVDCPADTPIEMYVHLSDVAGASVRRQPTLAVEPQMVTLPPGSFAMGSPDGEQDRDEDEGPVHEVRIGYRFALGRYPVTFDEYDAFCTATERGRPGDQGWGRARRPVINVSWYDAQAYVAWLRDQTGRAYRLPTEAEWEYACRAGTTTRYSVGDEITAEHASFLGNLDGTSEVGSYPANPWGLHDMHGNVWEWVEDTWLKNYNGAPVDGSAWKDGDPEGRGARGGCWDLDPKHLRCACRGRYHTNYRGGNLGFRVARTVS